MRVLSLMKKKKRKKCTLTLSSLVQSYTCRYREQPQRNIVLARILPRPSKQASATRLCNIYLGLARAITVQCVFTLKLIPMLVSNTTLVLHVIKLVVRNTNIYTHILSLSSSSAAAACQLICLVQCAAQTLCPRKRTQREKRLLNIFRNYLDSSTCLVVRCVRVVKFYTLLCAHYFFFLFVIKYTCTR